MIIILNAKDSFPSKLFLIKFLIFLTITTMASCTDWIVPLNDCNNKKIIVFTCGLDHNKILRSILLNHNINSISISSDVPGSLYREDIWKEYQTRSS